MRRFARLIATMLIACGGCFGQPVVDVLDLSEFKEFRAEVSRLGRRCLAEGDVVSARIHRDDGAYLLELKVLGDAFVEKTEDGSGCPANSLGVSNVRSPFSCIVVDQLPPRAMSLSEVRTMLALFRLIAVTQPSDPRCLLGVYESLCTRTWFTWDTLTADDWPCHLGDLTTLTREQSAELRAFLAELGRE